MIIVVKTERSANVWGCCRRFSNFQSPFHLSFQQHPKPPAATTQSYCNLPFIGKVPPAQLLILLHSSISQRTPISTTVFGIITRLGRFAHSSLTIVTISANLPSFLASPLLLNFVYYINRDFPTSPYLNGLWRVPHSIAILTHNLAFGVCCSRRRDHTAIRGARV